MRNQSPIINSKVCWYSVIHGEKETISFTCSFLHCDQKLHVRAVETPNKERTTNNVELTVEDIADLMYGVSVFLCGLSQGCFLQCVLYCIVKSFAI